MTQSMSLWMLVQAALVVRRGPDRGRQANSPPPAETGVGELEAILALIMDRQTWRSFRTCLISLSGYFQSQSPQKPLPRQAGNA